MDRRRFLAGLFASGVIASSAPVLIEEVSRVYSFPTNIVIAQPALPPGHMQLTLHTYLETYYNKKFIDQLARNTAMAKCWGTRSIPRATGKPITMYVPSYAN